jgi:hypothetical protein
VRFAIALVTLLIAGVLVAAGVAQRTVLKPEDHVTVSADVPSGVHYVLVPGSVLQSHEGQQRLRLSGSGVAFAAYGRTSDVTAWLSGQRYAQLTADPQGALTAPVVRTAPVVAGLRGGTPDPNGADLWIDQRRAERNLDWTVDVPASMSVLIASDGSAAAPSDVRLTWPVRTGTPLAVPLIGAGGALAVVGLLLYLWALVHFRRQRGPRRKSSKMPKRPQPPKYRPQRPTSVAPAPGRGRRSVRNRTALGVSATTAVLAGALLAPTTAPAVAATPAAAQASVTEEQAVRIVHRVAQVAATADKALDAKVLGTRFTGAALALRTAAYRIRSKDDKASLPQTIPLADAAMRLILPQATSGWPRTLFAVVADKDSTKVAPVALALVQNDPRSDYRVQYSMGLMPGAKLPDLPSALDGASRLTPEAKVLRVEPGTLAADYGAVLRDSAADTAAEFDTSNDKLLQEVGEQAKKRIAKKLGATAGITFKDLATDPESAIALSTADSGALVAVQLDEQWTVKPKSAGVTVRPSGGTRILSKTGATSKGISSVYGYQLLFAVPSAGSKEPIVLLGYDQGLISAKEL